jgi:hypothetical protein
MRWVVMVMLIGCKKGPPSHDECLRAVAYERFMEDLTFLGGSDLARRVSEDGPPDNSDEARIMLNASDGGARPPRDSMPLVETCTKLSRAHVDCVLKATSLEAIRACPEHPAMPEVKPHDKPESPAKPKPDDKPEPPMRLPDRVDEPAESPRHRVEIDVQPAP